jgi:replicative DNA helicase
MGAHAVLARHGRVAHFVLEGTTEQAILRYLSRLTGIEYGRLEKDDTTPEERKKIDRISKKLADHLYLFPLNKHWTYTVHDIEAKLKEAAHAGKKPDLVVIDYADLLNSVGRYESKRHEQTEVYRDLKRLAMSGEYAIWTASQAVRPKEDPDKEYTLRSKDISESFEKVRIADLVATLNQTPKEREEGIVRLHIDIYRSNDTDNTIRMITNFEKMIFYSKKYEHLRYEDKPAWAIKRKKGR